MKNSIPLLIRCTTLALLALARPTQADTSLAGDAEDSPLYAASMRNAFTDFGARDHAPPVQPPVRLDSIIVVEGGKWRALPGGDARDPRPKPRDVTMDLTCGGGLTCTYGKTCATYPTCQGGTTCNAGPTCYGVPTCYYSMTCQGWPTCSSTCSGQNTCSGGPTCVGYPTCYGPTCSGATCVPQYTCYISPTCVNTCMIGFCSPPTITAVNVPEPGQFQLSFSAWAGIATNVSYNVQFCTNLDAPQWTTVFSIPANNSTVTFTHTNNAPRAYYRVRIQNL